MRFTIDVSTNRILDHRRVNRICAFTVMILLGVLCWNVFRISWNIGESRRLADEINASKKQPENRSPDTTDKDSARIRSSIGFFNEIIARKSFGWLDFLEQVEIVDSDGIALSGLAPDRKSGTVKIEGWARDFGKVRAYLESLEESPYFQAVQLVSHKDVVLWEEARGVKFSIVCRVKSP
jgi:hypothetical protein